MIYLEILLFTNIFIMFELTIYIIFFYIKNYYNHYKKSITEEIFLLLNGFLILFLYFKFNINNYIVFLTLNILLSLIFDKIGMSIFITIWNSAFLIYSNNKYLIYLYIIYLIIYYFYKRYKRKKIFFTNCFASVTLLYLTIYFIINSSLNYQNILIVIIYLISIYLITFYIIYLKRKIKLYITIKDIEHDKVFRTSIFKVTHEIKNPLAVIKGYLSIFDINDSKKSKRYINILNNEVNNALMVLKDFSELGNLKIIKEYMSFNDLLFEVKETIIPFFTNKRINLKIDSEKDIYIYADYNRLKQVFINILKNACEALDIMGKINIKAYTNNNKLIINIKDNGCGMTDETIDNLFTPFYSKKSNGTGLGLCLSKEIIENHGGKIKYSSVINKYTLVEIKLPIN